MLMYYGWVIVIVIGLTGIVQSAQGHPALGVIMKPMIEEFGWSRSQFTTGMTIGSFLGGFLAVGFGPLIDRYGGRWVLTFGSAFIGGTLVLTGFVLNLWQFVVLQILARAINMGLVALAMQVIIPKWFIKKRGRAVAFGGIGGILGNAITPVYLQFFINHLSWRFAVILSGFIVWIIAIIPTAFLLRRSPEDLCLKPDGDTVESKKTIISKAVGNSPDFETSEFSYSISMVVRQPSFYLLVIAFTLATAVGSSINLHTIPYLSDRGLTSTTSVYIMSVFSVTGVFGALAIGFLVERIPIRSVLTADFLLVASGFIILVSIDSPVAGFVWGGYAGFVGGGMFTLQSVIFADYYGRGSLATIRGVTSPMQMAANAFGPLLAAIAFDVMGNYLLIFGIYGLLMALSAGCAFLARRPSGVNRTLSI
ncbi:MFS transporter [SAR202 cluster bacterium AD-802-E10_MRT_200m]|nr:MFS transporter [SAR202 cluster bacterium AD-802-E10_MRT_200m]MQF82943.1 MFS transporter [SAR202 cluster bacterium AD-802-E10_MRT_200m]